MASMSVIVCESTLTFNGRNFDLVDYQEEDGGHIEIYLGTKFIDSVGYGSAADRKKIDDKIDKIILEHLDAIT